MKNTLVLLLAFVSFSAFSQLKIGVVNVQKVIKSVKIGKSVDNTLKKSFKAKEGKLKKEEAAIKKLQKDLQKQNLVLSDKAKAKRRKEIQEKIVALQKKSVGYQREMQKQELELKKPILEKLKGVIESVAKAEKVSLAFEASTSPLVYAESKVDLTDKVIKAFDKKYKK